MTLITIYKRKFLSANVIVKIKKKTTRKNLMNKYEILVNQISRSVNEDVHTASVWIQADVI